MPPTSHLTWRVGYVKLHGRRCGRGFLQFDDRGERTSGNNYLYRQAELENWAMRIRHIARFADQVFVIFNNDGGGKAVLNALQMQAIVTGLDHRPPKMLARAYRAELPKEKQETLFSSAA
jgi:uncharacterized protein YecE (DUF72 family)